MNLFDDNFGLMIFAGREFSFSDIQRLPVVLRRDPSGPWGIKPVITQADPFLFVRGDELYLFFEHQRAGEPGRIAMMKTRDLQTWTEPVIVLQEPFHLSFPHVFEDGGKVYMIPETQAADSVRLYCADGNDLSHFTLCRTLLSRKRTPHVSYSFSDSHVWHQDGLYYLFTSFCVNWKYSLELYVAENLEESTFRRHPSSPICTDNEYGRCAGSLIAHDGELFRVSQDCHAAYGANVSVMRVKTLSPDSYAEELADRNIFRVSGGEQPVSDATLKSVAVGTGVHQLSIVRFLDRYVYSTDYKTPRFHWYQKYSALKRLLRR